MSSWAEVILKVLELFTALLRRRSAKEQMLRMVAMYEAMKKLVSEGLVHRVLIVKVEDSGGRIKPGVQIYASALYEDYQSSIQTLKPIREIYQRIAVDKSYMSILAKLMTDGYADIFTVSLEDGFIKNKYDAEKVKYAEWYLLHQNKKAVYFLSLVTTSPDDTFDNPYQRNVINTQVNVLQNIISGKKWKNT